MTELGKIFVAGSLSVLAHVSLFTALVLMPERALVPTAKPLPEETPLEVTIEAAPADEVHATALARANALQTQLDPANLKRADKAPERPKEIAAHDSVATPARAAVTPLPVAPPSPEPAALALDLAAPPSPSPQSRPDEAGIDAVGNYGKAVGNAIGLRWKFYLQTQKDLPVGEVLLKFTIDAQGRVSEVKVLSNTAAPVNATVAMRAVKEAIIPPIPPERLAQVPGGRMEITYNFTSFPDK